MKHVESYAVFFKKLYIFGRNIPDYGDVFGGTTPYDVVPIHLLYAALYRSGGAWLGVVAFDAGCGGNDALLAATAAGVWPTEKYISKS